MVKSATDDETGTAPDLRPTRKPVPSKIIVMGSIPITDTDFLAWRELHCRRLAKQDAMLLHTRDLNGQNKIRLEQEMEQWKTYMRSRLSPEQKKELEGLRARNDELDDSISEHKALYETRKQAAVLAPQNTPHNILSFQVVPNPQNIPPPPEQSSPHNHSAPPPLEQPPSLNIPPPSGEQMTNPPASEQPYVLGSSPETIDANKLTMQQALDLFEMLQARKSKEAEKSVTVEAKPVARAPARAEPLSYLTLGTVEGIIGSTNPDTLQEQTSSWEGKVEKYMRLSHSYSSENTISGEKCYMVNEALYKDILLIGCIPHCRSSRAYTVLQYLFLDTLALQ